MSLSSSVQLPASRWFKPLRGKAKVHRIASFDVEGSGGPGGFVVGAVSISGMNYTYNTPASMWGHLLELGRDGYMVFAHNLEYDLPIVAGAEWTKGRLVFKQSGLLWATYEFRGRDVTIYDSLNLFPHYSVRDLGAVAGLPKLDLDPALLRLISDGYPLDRLTPAEAAMVRRYCVQDAEIVRLALEVLQDTALALGGSLKPTIASVAMDVYRRAFHKWPWPVLPDLTQTAARQGYFGGRVENYYIGEAENVNMYDVNSLYPSVQATARFPHPAHVTLETNPASLSQYRQWEGMARARVLVPEVFIPNLPHRADHRLFFPTGELTGTWPLVELRAAVERGARLLSIDWVLGTKVTFNPFAEYVGTLWGQRHADLEAGNPRHATVKLILNSLYGRFGLNPDNGLFTLSEFPTSPDFSKLKGAQSYEWQGRLMLLTPLSFGPTPAYVNVMFAAQISAAGRLRLFEGLASQAEDAVYCDTDSIITYGELPTGGGLGEWRKQMSGGTADLLGPKEYALHNAVSGIKYVVKGVPQAVAEDYLRQGYARFQRALRIREAIGLGLNPAEWVEVMRARGDVVMKRQPSGSPFAAQRPRLTFPWALPELREYLAGGALREARELVAGRVGPQGYQARALGLGPRPEVT